MRRLLRYSALLAAALWLATGGAASSLEVYGSKEGDYSVNFPASPQEEINNGGNFRVVSHALRHDGVIYIVAHGDFAEPVKPDVELDANIDNYVNAIRGCRLTWRGALAFARGARPLPAKQFLYESDQLTGKGFVVVDGASSYLVAASVLKPYKREKAAEGFLASFTLVPKKD